MDMDTEAKRKRKAAKEVEREAILQQISTEPFDRGDKLWALKKYGALAKHLDKLCLKLLPGL